MKPVMAQKQPPADAVPPDETVGLPQQDAPPAGAELPAAAQKLVHGAMAILWDDRFVPVMRKAVESAADFAAAAALIVFGLIERAQRHMKIELPHDVLWANGGVGDHLMAAVFKYGEEVGIPEATDQATYSKAMDMVEDMGSAAEGGGGAGAAPEPQPAAAPPQQEMV